MFHKPGSSLGVGPNKKKSMDVPLKKSDRKSLRKAALDLVHDNVQDECAIVFQQAFLDGILLQRKLTVPEGKVMLYTRSPSSDDDWPYRTAQVVWISLDDGSKTWAHAPTVALLALLPVNSFDSVLVPSAASKYLCRGAHLMRAGMCSLPEPTISRDGLVVICVQGNPQPMAVGRLTRDTSLDTIGTGSKGIGAMIWTCYGDDIWKSQLPVSDKDNETSAVSPTGGAPFDLGHYGNVGFLEGKYVAPIVQVGDSDEEDADKRAENEGEEDDTPVVDGKRGNQQGKEGETVDATDQPSDQTDTATQDDNDVNQYDLILHQAVCKSLALLKKSDLPITTANFYSQHVLPGSSQPIQLKQTSYKKLGRYLLEQTERGMLTCGPDKEKKDPMAYIVSVNRGHPDVKPYRQEESNNDATSKRKTAVVTLFIIPHHFVSLMHLNQDDVKAVNAKSPERQGKGMLTSPEVRAILEKYIANNELVDPTNPRNVRVDGPLCDALYKKHKGGFPTSVSRKELTTEWLKKMEPAYALVEMPGNRIMGLSRGSPPKVSIEVSKRTGNRKYSTRIRGLEMYGIDPGEFAKDVSRRFACSTTVDTNPDGRAALKKGHAELVLQGNLEEEMRALLLGNDSLTNHGGAKGGEYCLPKNVIEVTLRKGVPAKKRG